MVVPVIGPICGVVFGPKDLLLLWRRVSDDFRVLPQWDLKPNETPTVCMMRKVHEQFGIPKHLLEPVAVDETSDQTLVLIRYVGEYDIEEIDLCGELQDRAWVDIAVPLPGYMNRLVLPDLEILQKLLSKVPKI